MNLKFEYLYRDGGNYKQFGQTILTNKTELDTIEATRRLKEKLIDGEFFIPSKVGVPFLEVYAYDQDLDHGWYEFDKISDTLDPLDQNTDILEFIERFK